MIEALYVIGAPILRSITGWAEKSLDDNKVTRFELRKLAKTVIRTGTLAVLGYAGFQTAGVQSPELIGALSGFIADKLIDAVKENKNVTRT